jgi:hypothetical protein
MTWPLLRRYSAILWVDNLDAVKAKVDKMALALYKQSGDPFDALLYYIMLGKRSLITMLFKKELALKP